MDYKRLRIVFMGTPDFAVASLSALINTECNVVAVVTAPDKPAGRGMKITESAVKQFAVHHQIPVLQPVKLKDEIFLHNLKSFQADIQVVVAFRMLPEVVWNMPPMGTINVHGSLLPQYRGAAPINWAVINGDKETGVTTFKLQHAIDTGNILLQASMTIDENETATEVHDKMKFIGANLLVETIQQIANGTLQEKSQENFTFDELRHAPKIFTETCKIDFDKSVEEVHNLIRGLSMFPGAFTYLNNKLFKIYRTSKEISAHQLVAGTFLTNHTTILKVACNNGFVHLHEVQLEGKKKMLVKDFLQGNKIDNAVII